MRTRAVVLAATLVMAPLGARAADLVVWWEEGYYAQEDAALREIIAAFEQESGKQVELVFYPMEASCRKDSRRRWRRASRPTSPSASGCPTTSGMGLRRSARGSHRTPSATFRTCSIRHSSTGPRCSTQRRARGLCTACRWASSPTSPTSGRASWSRPVSPSRTSRESGKRTGPSGATRCSRPCAGPRAATTSGAWGFTMSAEAADTRECIRRVHGCLRGRLRDARRPARDRRAGGQAQRSSRPSTATRRSIARAAPRPVR